VSFLPEHLNHKHGRSIAGYALAADATPMKFKQKQKREAHVALLPPCRDGQYVIKAGFI
jgi:hypothetical protein